MSDGLWKRVQDEVPQEFVNVFFVDPEEGVSVGYYNGSYWKADDHRIWGKVVYWMPIEYPKPPEGSVDTDWD